MNGADKTMKTKQIISMLLALLMTAGSFVSCSGRDAEESGNQPVNNTELTDTASVEEETEPETEAETEPEDLVYKADIPEGTNYDGYNFRVMVMDPSTIVWSDTDFSVLEPSAEVVENAVYQRKMAVEEQLGVKITPVYGTGNIAGTIATSIIADDDSFDICFSAPLIASGKITDGLFLNLRNFENIDLADAWWDQNSVNDLTVDGKLYLVAGDIGYNYKRSTSVLFFNKNMITVNGLDNPYELVQNNKWTAEKMFEMADVITTDSNGDGAYKAGEDVFGFAHCPDTLYQMLVGGDVRMAETNDAGIPEITFMNEHTIDVFNTVTGMFYDENRTYNWEKVGVNAGNEFTSDKLLFMPTEFWVITTFREMDTDFGVLPIPKYTEEQADYHHCVNQSVAAMMLIPKTNRDHARTGNIVSALGAEGKNLITPAYYEVALKTKMSRDMESEAMFDIIFNSITWDPGFMYDIGSIKAMLSGMVSKLDTELASTYQRQQKVFTKGIDRLVKGYAELNG